MADFKTEAAAAQKLAEETAALSKKSDIPIPDSVQQRLDKLKNKDDK